MTPNQQAALDKIKKLLRMKRGGTRGEIENALTLAAKLAREHGIDLSSVNPEDDNDRPISHQSAPLGARVPVEMHYAIGIVVNFFNVQVCVVEHYSGRNAWVFRGKPRFTASYVGTDWDIEVARYVFHFLVQHFRRCWSQRAGRLRNRQAFLHGMFLGLSAKLRAAQPQPESNTPGLIVVERALAARKAYLANLHPGSKDKDLPEEDSDAYAARFAGYLAGRDTEIRPALKGDRNERGELMLA